MSSFHFPSEIRSSSGWSLWCEFGTDTSITIEFINSAFYFTRNRINQTFFHNDMVFSLIFFPLTHRHKIKNAVQSHLIFFFNLGPTRVYKTSSKFERPLKLYTYSSEKSAVVSRKGDHHQMKLPLVSAGSIRRKCKVAIKTLHHTRWLNGHIHAWMSQCVCCVCMDILHATDGFLAKSAHIHLEKWWCHWY